MQAENSPGLAQTFRRALIVVAKRPAPGKTKTRLSPPLSPEQAAILYERFLIDTLEIIRQVPAVGKVIAYHPAQTESYFASLAGDFETILQVGSNLGERLDHCLTCYLNRGFESVLIMSSDVPNLPPAYLELGFKKLEQGADVVIGPCDDGGYYLIGIKSAQPTLLRDVRMSTPHVTADTLSLAEAAGLKVDLLPAWYDIDNVHALRRLILDLDMAPDGVGSHTRSLLSALDIASHPALRR